MAGVLNMGVDELRDRLLAFDRAVGLLYPGEAFRLVFVGGGAMVLLGRLARLVPLGLDTKSVECYTASLEDIVASKLYSGRETDAADVRRPEVLAALDWDLLAAVIADMEGSKLVERRHREFLHNYEAHREEFGPCDD